ncbi:MAG: FHA domain-containing protein [Planctomycetota bacterium]
MEKLLNLTLGQELAAGSYSTVYEASRGGENCAVRVLSEDRVPDDPDRRDALVQALQGLAEVNHPSVVRVLDADENDGRLFLAMELMGSPTLAHVLRENGRMDEKQAVLFVRQAAQALDKAREVGYFHGNLHAGNVFVLSPEKIKISDFAVRRLAEDPEVAAPSGGLKDVRERLGEDFTGLAVLLMQMLGASPPERENGEAVDAYGERLLRGPFEELSDPSLGVSPRTREIVQRLLTPGSFDSPGELVVELASAMLLHRPGAGAAEPAERAAGGKSTVQVSEEDDSEAWEAAPAEDVMALSATDDPREAPMTPFFIWENSHAGRFFVVQENERVSIGRDPDAADVVLRDPSISRCHCHVAKQDGVITLEDPGSTNGTFVNEERVQRAEVHPGDTVRVGGTRFYMSVTARER